MASTFSASSKSRVPQLSLTAKAQRRNNVASLVFTDLAQRRDLVFVNMSTDLSCKAEDIHYFLIKDGLGRGRKRSGAHMITA